MQGWTASAREELERYCKRARIRLADSGADADEVVEDLRRHIETECERAGLKLVTAEDVRRIAASLGEPDTANPEAPPREAQAVGRPIGPHYPPGAGLLFIAVILPALTLFIEATTHFCAGAFFDPIPSWWHALAIFSVPVINGITWHQLRMEEGVQIARLNWMNAAVVTIAGLYAIIFLPLMLFGVIFVIYFGLGLLPCAPILAFAGSWRLRWHLNRHARRTGRTRLGGLAIGMLVGVAAVLLPDLPNAITKTAMQFADSEDPLVSQRGVNVLRRIGHQETMLRTCYDRSRRYTDFAAMLISPDDRLTQEEARKIFFRVTGRPFNSVPPPELFMKGGRWNAMNDNFTWDFDSGLGGEAVAGRVKGLSLISSRMDTLVVSDEALSYTEWILEFKNVSPRQREARLQIALPADGVVSRLTLWVNGEEREAAFAGRSQVRKAYQKVAVEQRKDPVLVTTSGPDRVMMQCFPVPPNGETMKVRIGVTAPLVLDGPQTGLAFWPRIIERNFNFAPGASHSVWAQSKANISFPMEALRHGVDKSGRHRLQGDLTDNDLMQPGCFMTVQRDAAFPTVWAEGQSAESIVVQRADNRAIPGANKVILVIDGSAGMQPFMDEIANALKAGGSSLKTVALVASDSSTNRVVAVSDLGDGEAGQALADRVSRLHCAGGQDNLPALREGFDTAIETEQSALVWIHGPQPVVLGSPENFRQRLERNGDRVRIFDFQTHPGPNRVIEALGGLGVHSFARRGSVETDLNRLFKQLAGNAKETVMRREEKPKLDAAKEGMGAHAGKHVARLWARQHVEELAAGRRTSEAVALAGRYQLVTSVSGAVVLETQQQFDAAGLTPVDPMTIPMIPEPATTTLLLLCAVGAFAMRRFRMRRKSGAP